MGTSLFENCSQNLGLQWVQAAAGQAVEAAFAAQMFVIVGEIVERWVEIAVEIVGFEAFQKG